MKIIYAGTPDFAVPALQALLQSEHQLLAVYTQPDRPAGRGRKLSASPVKKLAVQNDLPVLQPTSFRQQETRDELRALQADVMIVAAYGLILPEEVLAAPRHGGINIHASLLPRWRGAAPIQRAIAAGDSTTGVTIMQMARGLDTGDMLLKRETAIASSDTGSILHDRLAELGAEAIITTLTKLRAGELSPKPQDDALATYAKKLSKKEAQVDWSRPAQEIVRMIMAFNAWPVAQTVWQGKVMRLWAASLAEEPLQAQRAKEQVGTVVMECPKRGMQVVAGTGSVWLSEIQMPGKKPMPVRDFLNARSALNEVLG